MKNSKFVLAALMLICASCLFAQDLHRGDTIRIKPSNKRYLTSEKMSPWVYTKNHIVLQVGGARFNNGVLVEGIYSWVDPVDIKLVAPCTTCREEETREAQLYADSVAAAQAEAAAIEAAEIAREQAAREQLRQDSIRQAEEDSIARAQKYAYMMAHRPVNRFTIGVRGGAASMMQDMGEVGKGKVGFDVALDLQYAHYWKTKKEHNVGILVGASAAFARNNVKGSTMSKKFTLPSCDGDIDYHITGEIENLAMNEVQVEVPVMFSMVLNNGFFLNIGPKLMVPVYSFYKQNLSGADITATFVKEDVTLKPNNPVTGVFPEDQKVTKGKWHNAAIHLMLAGELGYEFKLKNNDAIGLGVYGGYSVYSVYNNDKQLGQPQPSHVQIDVPTATSVAGVKVVCASDVYMNKLGFWDAGLKVAYHFNWPYRNDNK